MVTLRRPLKKYSRRTQELTGNTGASMTVELDLASPISSYSIRRADKTPVGTADFVAISDVREERIFFHTEVFQVFGGRDLVELLVSRALTDSIREDATIVPLCPMFARHRVIGQVPAQSRAGRRPSRECAQGRRVSRRPSARS